MQKHAIFSIHSILLFCWFLLFVFWSLAVNCHKINWYFYAGYLTYLAERGRVRRCLLSLQLIDSHTNHKTINVKCHHGLVDKVLYSLSWGCLAQDRKRSRWIFYSLSFYLHISPTRSWRLFVLQTSYCYLKNLSYSPSSY